MTHIRIKLIVAGVLVAGAIAILAVSGISDGWVYFLPVDEFIQKEMPSGQRVRLHGIVGEPDLVVSKVELRANFALQGETHSVRVAYRGVIPNQFQSGRDVVVEGSLDDAGIFQADTLLTKCASKYQSAEGEDSQVKLQNSTNSINRMPDR